MEILLSFVNNNKYFLMEKSKGVTISKVLPVMFGFYIMGFVDIIGVVVSFVKTDFSGLSDTVVNLISFSTFLWFLVLAIPTGILLNKIGRKKTVVISFFIQVIGLIIPVFSYNYLYVLICFGLIGIGNTMLQVALNPLVTNVISEDKLSGTLTLGQFIKAVCSLLGPILAAWFSSSLYGWRLVFPVYAGLSLVAGFWLIFTNIPENKSQNVGEISVGSTFSLLKDRYIRFIFIGIMVLVGVDVGINITFPKLLMQNFGFNVSDAGMGNSIYFFARTVGAFLGSIIMMRISEKILYKFGVFIALAGLLLMLINNNIIIVFIGVSLFGLGYANLFAILFSLALKYLPQRKNGVSALLIIGVSGGGILPPILGVLTDVVGTQMAGIIGIAVIWSYMVWLIKTVHISLKKDIKRVLQ